MIITYRKYGMNFLYITLGILFIFIILFFVNFDENFNVEDLTKIRMDFYGDIPPHPPKNLPAPIELPYTQPPRPTRSTATPSPPPAIPPIVYENGFVPVNKPTITTFNLMTPVDCIYYWNNSKWSNCVDGSSIRIRTPYTVPPQYGGATCTPGVQIDPSTCTMDCQYNWSDTWPSCIPGNSVRTRYPESTIPPANGGAECTPGIQKDTTSCPVDCQYSWYDRDWSPCINTSPTRSRRAVKEEPINGGATCTPRIEIDLSTCPMDCQYNWDVWPTCGPGDTTRTRLPVSTIAPFNGGATCTPGVDIDYVTCVQTPTPTTYPTSFVPNDTGAGGLSYSTINNSTPSPTPTPTSSVNM